MASKSSRHSFQLPNSLCYAAVKVGGRRNGLICATEYFIAHDQTLITSPLSLPLPLCPSRLPSIPHPELAITYVNLMSPAAPAVHPTKK